MPAEDESTDPDRLEAVEQHQATRHVVGVVAEGAADRLPHRLERGQVEAAGNGVPATGVHPQHLPGGQLECWRVRFSLTSATARRSVRSAVWRGTCKIKTVLHCSGSAEDLLAGDALHPGQGGGATLAEVVQHGDPVAGLQELYQAVAAHVARPARH